MALIECRNLKIKFGAWQSNFNGSFEEGSWHVLCGGSGSGKSTLFQVMLGLLRASSGDILIDGKSIVHLAPHARQMSFMAQNNILLPHLTIYENLLLSLHDSTLSKIEKSNKIMEILELLKLNADFSSRMPHELSGGQTSRCNLARALLRPCRWLLLDEPFAAVDRPTRLSILEWLKSWQNRSGAGILLVSHDLDDIFNVATHVTVVESGQIIESESLMTAISHPKKIPTAAILRSGVILRNDDSSTFVSSANLYLAQPKTDSGNDNLSEIRIPDARAIRVGNLLRIVDLKSGIDVTLPANHEFNGSLWFHKHDELNLARS